MAYIPKTKSEFYDMLGSMVLRCPEYRSRIPSSDHGLELSFQIMNGSIVLLYKDAANPIRQQLLRMSTEAKCLSEAAIASSHDREERKDTKEALAARQILVDMERLMKGKALMYYSE